MDEILSRFVEAFLALPLVVTGVLAVVALGHSHLTLILVIGIVFTPLIARTVRAAVLQESASWTTSPPLGCAESAPRM